MSNMVWGIETVVPMANGWSRSASVSAAEYHNKLQLLLDTQLLATPSPVVHKERKAPIRYNIMTTVPEHWISFVPEHIESNNRKIQLRRAAIPRYLENDTTPSFERVRPRTTLLREGWDSNKPYHIHEEEVSRAGAHVIQSFQRTRRNNGQVYTWLGVKKQVRRGEGNSGLAYDELTAAPK